jgi:hypothetical protein
VVDEREKEREKEKERERDKGTEEFFVHDWNEGETFGAEIRRGEKW